MFKGQNQKIQNSKLNRTVRDLFHTLQEPLGPFLSDEAPLMAFRDSASYRYSYLCRVLYLLATGRENECLEDILYANAIYLPP